MKDQTAAKGSIPGVDNSPAKTSRRHSVMVPTRDDDGVDWELEGGEINALAAAYPNLDVSAVIKDMIIKLWRRPKAERWSKNKQGAKRGVWDWFEREAGFAVKGRSRFRKAAPKQPAPWWKSDAGWIEQGQLNGIEQEPGELFTQFQARVCLVIGDGAWSDNFLLQQRIEDLKRARGTQHQGTTH